MKLEHNESRSWKILLHFDKESGLHLEGDEKP